jgi:taurine--2-oxoglutarate transaminase
MRIPALARHPFFFTWTAQGRATPIELIGGSGAFFHTADGERWLDLGSFVYQVNAGHGNQRIVDAVRGQAERLCVSVPGAVYPEKVALAERLLELAPPGFDRVFFTLGGSDANENAIKIARLFTGRHKLIARYRSYHGATMGAVSLTGDWRRPPVEPGLAGVVHVSDFECAACDGGTRAPDCAHEPLTNIPRTLELEGPGTVAAVFLESVVGANGVLVPPPDYLTRVRRACDRDGALLVMDEVLSGFGRAGRWFALERFDHGTVVPDMITCGKALTSGYGTLGAVLVHERVSRYFDDHLLAAGLTHYAHPLGVAAALEALRVYEDEGLVERAASLEPVLSGHLESLGARSPVVVRNRVIGLLSATELALDAAGWTRLRAALRSRRVHAHVQEKVGALVLAPPLVISEADLADGISRVAAAIEESV